jgi:hypothetical protein
MVAGDHNRAIGRQVLQADNIQFHNQAKTLPQDGDQKFPKERGPESKAFTVAGVIFDGFELGQNNLSEQGIESGLYLCPKNKKATEAFRCK